MINILNNSICTNSNKISDEIILVSKTNLMKILELLDENQRISLLHIFGLTKPNFNNLKEVSCWANDAIRKIDIKRKELATEAQVSPCDVTYLLNEDERLTGTGRIEKIINKLYEKLEQKFALELFSKSS